MLGDQVIDNVHLLIISSTNVQTLVHQKFSSGPRVSLNLFICDAKVDVEC
jgi:hypothetical protein